MSSPASDAPLPVPPPLIPTIEAPPLTHHDQYLLNLLSNALYSPLLVDPIDQELGGQALGAYLYTVVSVRNNQAIEEFAVQVRGTLNHLRELELLHQQAAD